MFLVFKKISCLYSFLKVKRPRSVLKDFLLNVTAEPVLYFRSLKQPSKTELFSGSEIGSKNEAEQCLHTCRQLSNNPVIQGLPCEISLQNGALKGLGEKFTERTEKLLKDVDNTRVVMQ